VRDVVPSGSEFIPVNDETTGVCSEEDEEGPALPEADEEFKETKSPVVPAYADVAPELPFAFEDESSEADKSVRPAELSIPAIFEFEARVLRRFT